MLKFVFYFIFLVVLMGGLGLVAWFVFDTFSHRRGRHRDKRRHHRRHRAAATPWLPIATFRDEPRGTVRALLWADGEARLGFYDERSACWRRQADDRGEPLRPTHWMPLPGPPMV